MIIAANYIETSSVGFSPCWWPATSLKQAIDVAKSLSERLAQDPRYPNAFHVSDSNGKAVCKFFRGVRYEPSQTV